MSRTKVTASEEAIIEGATVDEVERPMNEREIEAVRNTISGMSDQEKKLAAATLPIGLLFERIQNEVVASREKLDKIAAILNE